MIKVYAGIGARATPLHILKMMTEAASFLEQHEWTLRSGGAKGADQAFESGVSDSNMKEIYLAKDWNMEAAKIAAQFHPAWNKLSPYVQTLMARNSFQVLGPDLNTPSQFIMCWTPKGEIVGGTGQALRVAEAYEIPVVNFGNRSLNQIEEILMEITS